MGFRPISSRSLGGIEALEQRTLMAIDFALAPIVPASDPAEHAAPVIIKQPIKMQVGNIAPGGFVNGQPLHIEKLGQIRPATENRLTQYRNTPPGYGLGPIGIPVAPANHDAALLELTLPDDAAPTTSEPEKPLQ